MHIVELVQRTPQWHAWRRKGISASHCAVIMGEHPDKTRLELWQELTGAVSPADLSVIPQVKRGIKFEPLALQAFEERYGQLALPFCAESSEYPFMRASFDGVLEDNAPVEIKNLSDTHHLEVLQAREQSAAYRLYRWQVMHQLIVSGGPRGYLWCWSPRHEPCCLVVERDEALFADIIQAQERFWAQVVHAVAPAADPTRDLVPLAQLDMARWRPLAQSRRELERQLGQTKAQLKRLTQEAKVLDAQFLGLMGVFRRADVLGIKVTSYPVSGAVDWEAVAHALAPQISPALIARHQAEPSHATRFTVDAAYDESQLAAVPPTAVPQTVAPEAAVDEPSQYFGTFWF